MADTQKRTFKDQFMLRLPDGMRDRIKKAAEASGRSMNAEIVDALLERYPEPNSVEHAMNMVMDLAMISGALSAESDPQAAEAGKKVYVEMLKDLNLLLNGPTDVFRD